MFLDKLHKMGVFLLVLTGGEPFLNKKLEQFLWLAKAKGFVVELFSNLQQIPSWFWKLSPTTAMIGRIQVSIYSSDPIVHDRITTIKGSPKKSMNNLCELKRLGFYVEVATPLMKYNFDSWEETRKLFASLKIKQDFSWPIVDEYYSRKTGKSSLNIMASQFAKFVEKNPYVKLADLCSAYLRMATSSLVVSFRLPLGVSVMLPRRQYMTPKECDGSAV
jgi:MoaA/NifB/PqqE/SkfB family radical SAM enzyme